MKITKGFYQKNENNGYDNYTPLGTDGQLVDMNSGINLEYELKLGTKHLISIDTNEDITTVVEHYASPEEVEDTPNTKYYSLTTVINDAPGIPPIYVDDYRYLVTTRITASLYWIDNSTTPITQKLLKVKTSDIMDVSKREGDLYVFLDTRIEENYEEGE